MTKPNQYFAGQVMAKTAAVLVTASFIPSAIAVQVPSGTPVSEPKGIFVTDTGISRVKTGKAVIRAAMPKVETDRQSLRLSLDGFRVEGDPRLAPEALDGVLAPWRGRELTFGEYESAIHALAGYLREHGHPDAQVRMSRAIVGQGQIMIAIEGLSADQPVVAAAEVKPTVDVKEFKVSGVTVASDEEMQSVLADLKGKPLTAGEMELAAQRVANHLRGKGYPLVQAYLPPQRVDGGQLEIAVQEGRLDGLSGRDGVTVAGGGDRVKSEIIEEMVSKGTKPGAPLRMADLERGVLLASDLAGVKSVKTEIVPGSQPGTTQVKAIVEEGNVASASLWADNYGNRYTGSDRKLGLFTLNSPTGHGEQISLNLVNSDSSQSTRLGVQVPVGDDGWKVGAAYTDMKSSFSNDMKTIDLNSSGNVASLNTSYPLVRSALQNIYVGGGFDSKRFVTDLTWGRENDRKLDVANVTANGDFIDAVGGQNRWSTSISHGKTDLSAHALYEQSDALGPKTAGHFGKLNYQISRLDTIGTSNWTWLAGLAGQFASKNLDSAEKFQLGGPGGVRAYPVSEGIGDSGWLFNAELRYRLPQQTFGDAQLFGFYDAGAITQYTNTYNLSNGTPALGTKPNSYSLQGAGVGASVNVSDTGSVKVMWAKKMGTNPNQTSTGTDSDGTNNSSRIWIIGNIVF
jgi:hemolysin activation/secretion protein